jgi:hypothetical protein
VGGSLIGAAAVSLAIAIALVVMVLLLGLFVGCTVLLVKLARLAFSRGAARRPTPTGVPARMREAAMSVQTSRRQAAPAAATGRRVGPAAVDVCAETLLTWRYRQLLELELDPVTAAGAALAGTEASAVRALVEHGCPAPLALRILAPPGD